MKDFTLQISITGSCNCRCKHCYIEGHSSELTVKEIESILQQYCQLISFLENKDGETLRPLLNITGGEPLLYSDLDGLFLLLKKFSSRFVYRIATNGTLLNEAIIEKIKDLKFQFVQVSLDGNSQTHDAIRGKGNFQKVLYGLDLLAEAGINSRVSFTACKENYKEFSLVAEICRQHSVRTLWSDRYVPCSPSQIISPLSPIEAKEFVEILQQERKRKENLFADLSVQNYRSLQFLASSQFPYHCTAGEYSIAIDEKGNVYPCRRMFVVCGNIKNDTLKDIYLYNPTFLQLRKHTIPTKCLHCKYKNSCLGGAKCQAYAVYNNFDEKDPGCWL